MSLFSKSLTNSHISTLRNRSADSEDLPINTPSGPCAVVKITPITSPSHPANGQSGLFASRDLKPRTFIIQYFGEIHYSVPVSPQQDPLPPQTCPRPNPPPYSEAQATVDLHANSNYDLSLSRELGLGIDADKIGNEARFINDYRGVAERPNAEFREVWDKCRGVMGMGVWVLDEGRNGEGKAKGIRKGEEILVSYGRGFWGARKGEQERVDGKVVI